MSPKNLAACRTARLTDADRAQLASAILKSLGDAGNAKADNESLAIADDFIQRLLGDVEFTRVGILTDDL